MSESVSDVAKLEERAFLRETYCRLWGRAEGAGAAVIYRGRVNDAANKNGWFHPTGAGGEVQIVVVRANYRITRPHWTTNEATPVELDDDVIERELFTLAHEYGHMISFREGNRTPQYVAAATVLDLREEGKPYYLDEPAKRLIGDEEERAWLYARRQLMRLDWTRWKSFDAERDRALAIYQDIFAGAS